MTIRRLLSTTKAGRFPTPTRTLYLNVSPGGSKSWIQRLAIDGKRRNIGLGSVELVNFKAATKAALLNRVGASPPDAAHKLAAPGLAFDTTGMHAADVQGCARAFQSLVGGGMDVSEAAALSGLLVSVG